MMRLKKSLIWLFILLWVIQDFAIKSDILWYLLTCTVVLSVVWNIVTHDYDYWERRGIFSPPPLPIVGHIATVAALKEQGGMCFKRIYDEHKDKVRFLGTHQFYQRTLVVCDPEIIKRMCVNDFHHFTDRGFSFHKDTDPLAESVLFLRGSEWKSLRAKISPLFSPNKLRGMFPLIENTANEFVIRVKRLASRIEENNNEIVPAKEDKSKNDFDTTIEKNTERLKVNSDINSNVEESKYDDKRVVDAEKLVGGYTADAIVPCAFGVKSSVMDNPKDPFAVALHAFYEMSWFNIFEKTMRQFWPAFVLFFKIRIIPKRTHDFFCNIVSKVLQDRLSGVQDKRGDFIDMMMALQEEDSKSEAENDYKITDMIISANAFIIFLGGFETTSSTLAFLLLELAARPDVQEKLREELRRIELRYDTLSELSYMEMVIQETLRLYPPFPTIQRMCTRNYAIPDSACAVERGTIVLFPTLGIQRDERYFEKASEFIPERWLRARPAPGAYMPFGDGPRYCIGKRFAIMQMKCCLAKLLPHVKIKPYHSGQIRSGPFEADPLCPMTLHPKDSRIVISLL